MQGRNRRILTLLLIMVALVAAVSMYGTRLQFQTAIKEERVRLQELVQSQASLAEEMGRIPRAEQSPKVPTATRDAILYHIGRAQRDFELQSLTGEFIVARLDGGDILHLLINGMPVSMSAPDARTPLDKVGEEPMRRALFGETGTMIGPNHRGVEVVAAYAPIALGNGTLGLVARIDLDEIRAPFIRANVQVFGVGMGLTILCAFLFLKVSEPLIHDLQLSEKSYRDLVEGANNLILRINEAGEITFANSFARTFLVGADGGLLGRTLMSFFEVQAEGVGLEQVVEIIGGEGRQNEIPVRMVDGRVGYVSWTVKLVMDQGRPAELLCIGNDATRIHKANTAQKESEERFRGLAKASPVAIIITDIAGNLLYANEKMHELTRATAVQLAGQGWLNSVHREDRKLVWKHWLERVGPATDKVELRLMSGNGEFVWALWQVVEMGNTRGETAGNIHTFTDITEIKEAQLAMSRLNAAIDQAAEMIVMSDLDKVMTYVNPAFEAVSGYSRAEAVGKTTDILSSGEQPQEFYDDLWGTVAGGKVWKGRIVNRRKNGERYTVEASIGPIRNHAGELIGFVGLGRDISQQLVVESQLRQSQKLESIGELAAGIAHEINTPTQYVTSNLQFLHDSCGTYAEAVGRCRELIGFVKEHPDLFPDAGFRERAETALDEEEMTYLAEDVPAALEESSAGLKRIAEIVRSIKQLAHPGELAKAFHDLNEIVQNAVTVSTNEWKYVAAMDFTPDESLAPIFCLKGEVGQVVLNLIVNAAHAIESKLKGSDGQGAITIRTRSEGKFAVLEVTDTGTGMSQEIASKAFDPFFTTKEVGKGTGQGLAISHNVVVGMHGGRIEIDSVEGEGTTFTVRLPFEELPAD
ncbi:Blue-light-activated protein [Pseudodesulfovibrio hydrargyri]|uniref:histidine kinase n=1 Tax=Pseudodesulfovibrio hydrargyri TaxID=2125990 RepID=A0A1J5NET0_9BACT|nr:PAS domain S-box protein [Pseudodesulfovibrio hydrargyri]OIQ50233.1 Blue-light-activated protein [Pseudodesulfovibrio hydrargyri]